MNDRRSQPPPELDPRVPDVLADARRMGFFALVSLLERMSSGAVRVGGDGPPADEVLRFRNDPSMGFPASDVVAARLHEVPRPPHQRLAQPREVIEIVTTFLGLTGSVSPLPLYIPAEVAQDPSPFGVQRDFLDVFHHRLISLLYRLWTRYQLAREHTAAGDDAWTPRMLALTGFDGYAGAGLPLPPGVLLALTPLLCWHARGARTLELALRLLLREDLNDELALRIEQFVGGQVRLDEAQSMKLGVRNSVLGQSTVLGGRASDRTSSFAVALTLHGDADATAYMLGGKQLALVRSVVMNFLREPLDFELRVEVAAGGKGGFTLGSGATLGGRTWLRGRGTAQTFVVRDVVERGSGQSSNWRSEHAGRS
ncbi:MAG TPA: type VI secretion system baseplate subunit TssG [Polyangiales bacterium]|nr:type VI secretion system baseplate subunit TssG [Polyangiales bacterium]